MMKDFFFTGCVEIKELIGKKADDAVQLMELIDEVPRDCIYYHMHSYFLRHFYIVGPYSNDFANWAAVQLRDKVLGEKLSALTPSPQQDLEEIRSGLVDIIDTHLAVTHMVPSVAYDQSFYFMKSRIIEVPTDRRVQTLAEFRSALQVVDTSAIYNHIFEARLRVRRGRSDFAIWLEEVLGLNQLAERIERIDAYMYSLEGLRAQILLLCDQVLAAGEAH